MNNCVYVEKKHWSLLLSFYSPNRLTKVAPIGMLTHFSILDIDYIYIILYPCNHDPFDVAYRMFQTDYINAMYPDALGPVLLQRYDAVASLSANGSAAFKENCAPIS